MGTTQIIDASQLQQTASPMVNNATQMQTGLAVFMTANTSRTSATVVTAEANLSIQVNEAGVYRFEALMMFQGSANVGGGYIFDFSGGSATANTIRWAGIGTTNGAALTATIRDGAGVAFAGATVATAAPDYVSVAGVVTINAAGTFMPRWAQNFSNTSATLLRANSHILMTKIG